MSTRRRFVQLLAFGRGAADSITKGVTPAIAVICLAAGASIARWAVEDERSPWWILLVVLVSVALLVLVALFNVGRRRLFPPSDSAAET